MLFRSIRESDGIGLTEPQRVELEKLLISNDDIFKEPTDVTPFAIHRIRTKEHDPIAIPPYRLSPTMALKDEIARMVKLGVIVELVKKRICNE